MSLNTTATKVINYLTDATKPHPVERKQALQDLIENGAFTFLDTMNTKRAVKRYAERNPRGFCKDGLDAALVAMGLKEEKPQTIRVVLDLDLEGKVCEKFGSTPTIDDGFVSRLVQHLEGEVVKDPWAGKEQTVRNVRWRSYAAGIDLATEAPSVR